MTPQTKFRMASHSKLFTATAVMQLRERGKLRLDDPVSKYLPWFAVKSAEPDDPPITIEELLTHSSGLPREAGAHWTTYEFPTTEQLRKLMAERRAPFSPEVRWKYSNLAYLDRRDDGRGRQRRDVGRLRRRSTSTSRSA